MLTILPRPFQRTVTSLHNVSQRLQPTSRGSLLRPMRWFATGCDDPNDRIMALLLGPPGGGKGTIAKKILKEFDFYHLSSGDELRRHRLEGTAVGLAADEYIKRGDLVPDDVVVELVKTVVGSLPAGKNVLLDGSPRTMEQARAYEHALGGMDIVIQLDVPDATIVERISNRWVHMPSGRVYAYDYNPPKVAGVDDETGEELVQREDDKPSTVQKRLDTYAEVTMPLVDFYTSRGVLHKLCCRTANSPQTARGHSLALANNSGTESNVIYPMVRSFLERANVPATAS